MPVLVWDRVGDRDYESGLDRGVLYLPDGSAVPWNGLTSVIEHFNKESSPVYFDGVKIQDTVVLGEFAATMKAITYPDEFVELEGSDSDRRGLLYGDQPPKVFGLCYRVQVGNDAVGDVAGHKIHIIYNVTAIPSDKTYATQGQDPSLVEFEWDITAVPEDVPGMRPTAHITLDSRDFDPWLLEELEAMLYGASSADAVLLPMTDLVAYINDWYRIKITDNGDGTWSATTQRDGFINLDVATGLFELLHANAVYLDEVTYELSDTLDVGDVPQIKIFDNGDGTWTAQTDHPELISVDVDGIFTLRNATLVLSSSEMYRVTDTTD